MPSPVSSATLRATMHSHPRNRMPPTTTPKAANLPAQPDAARARLDRPRPRHLRLYQHLPDRDAAPLARLLEAAAGPGDRTRLQQGSNRHIHFGLIDKAG
ncbi:hypothetical protein PSM7751_02262 [Pseudooceanicola marinus]|uniref:Uncharacterized protein n=1 Tax=Pseudooceanicola marinus TaxID=396013 RepID=A0A1X6ZCM5_9RHOB|nr:hypothetical protein [Pseudooceanicola marinus]PJE28315.1 hypothetical protein CVM50_15340 [Pseudooceanicola marinus]SLN47724.1 hypothetical protein PSM7751_02262 [Pseudooceanicola marinus]